MGFESRRHDDQDYLPHPDQYRNDARFQHRLDKFFLRTEGRPALERLDELKREFKIGGALPHIAIRAEGGDRGLRIVSRHSATNKTKSSGIPADGLTEDEARAHPGAQAALEEFAQDVLFELQIKNAPATVLISTVLMRWLKDTDPSTGDTGTDRRLKDSNKKRNFRDRQRTFERNTKYAGTLVAEFLQDKRLAQWDPNFPALIHGFFEAKALRAGAEMTAGGQVAGARYSTTKRYVSALRQSRTWLDERLRPPIRLPLKPFNPKSARSKPFLWKDARLVMLWAQGYVFENRGFARHWVDSEDGPRLEYTKLPEPALSVHRAKYAPLLRALPALFTTATRVTVGINLGWKDLGDRGFVELDGKRSRIYRTGFDGADYDNKPRKPSLLPRIARGFFEVWNAKDLRTAEKDGWPDLEELGGHYVVHNGCGGPVPKIGDLLTDACAAFGITAHLRTLKHGAVTTLWLAGFELRRIGKIAGTDPRTTEEFYLYLEDEYDGIFRPTPDPETMTFARLVDPLGDMAKIPRAPAPPCPARPAAAPEALHA
jgi:hypothetical protein